MTKDTELRQGTLDMLILKALSLEPMHGWGISHRIRQISRDVLTVNQGSLYPALHRLERRGLIDSAWRASENNRRSRYYSITATGKAQLSAERKEWKRFMGAVQRILESL
jgi:PadR family transcriptional regulator, regulatory protein PadR